MHRCILAWGDGDSRGRCAQLWRRRRRPRYLSMVTRGGGNRYQTKPLTAHVRRQAEGRALACARAWGLLRPPPPGRRKRRRCWVCDSATDRCVRRKCERSVCSSWSSLSPGTLSRICVQSPCADKLRLSVVPHTTIRGDGMQRPRADWPLRCGTKSITGFRRAVAVDSSARDDDAPAWPRHLKWAAATARAVRRLRTTGGPRALS